MVIFQVDINSVLFRGGSVLKKIFAFFGLGNSQATFIRAKMEKVRVEIAQVMGVPRRDLKDDMLLGNYATVVCANLARLDYEVATQPNMKVGELIAQLVEEDKRKTRTLRQLRL
jgi:hypothetical protein